MKIKTFTLILILLAITLTACGSGTAHQPPTHTNPSAEDAEDVVQRNLDGIQAQHTLDAVNASVDATASVAAATATQAALNANAIAVAATEQAGAQATERAWELVQATMQAADAQATSTAQTGNQIGTATAMAANGIATASAQAESVRGTSTAQYLAVQDALQATADVNALNALATAQAADAEMATLALDRERLMNRVIAVAPWALGIISFILGCLLVYFGGMALINRLKVIRNKDDGTVDTIYDVSRTGTRVWKPDRATGAIITLDNHGNIDVPQPPGQADATLLAMLPAILQAMPGRNPVISDDFLNQMRAMLGVAQQQAQLPRSGEIIDVKVIDAGDPDVRDWLLDVEGQFTQDNILY